MKKLYIATASNLQAKRWRNQKLTWEDFRSLFLRVTETRETAEEFRAMDRKTQTRVKDVGAFVGGKLRDGIRKKTNVVSRSIVTLDYDSMPAQRVAEIRGALESSGWAWAMHSTHKHSERDARVRVAVPADREMTPDEYGAVARRVAERCGFEGIDRSTFEPCRLMFWGSRSKGAPFISEYGEGMMLPVDETLESYDDWTDMSLWPMSPEELGAFAFGTGGRDTAQSRQPAPKRRAAGIRKSEDPRQKRGLVGTFCRTFSVEEAITKFIPDSYLYHSPGRYTHASSTTAGGAVVEDGGLFLYSFHSTDPAGLRNNNAWDLVRIHRFGDLDADAEPGTRIDRMPSSLAMEEWAMTLPEMRSALLRERRATASDFDGFDLDEDEDEEDRYGLTREEWKRWEKEKAVRLTIQKDGSVKSTITNCAFVIGNDPRLRGRIRLDDFTGQIRVEGSLPWRRNSLFWTNNDDAMLRGFLDREYGISGAQKIDDALISVANDNGYHPVRSYLENLEWDGVRRLEGIFTDILGAEDTALNRELAKLIFAGAVSRVFKPGVKFDYFVIVKGPEGCGKSSLFSLMGGEWFSDSVASIEGKEGMESVQGKWIIEMPELVTTKRSEVESLKSFISRQEDRYRPAYGRKEEMRPRQCIMVGTTNEDHFLRGLNTGNRRSPVVDIDPRLRKVEVPVRQWVSENRDQVWAEAMGLYRGGYPLWLGDDLTLEARKTQDAHNLDKQNSLFPEVVRFLDLPLPSGWELSYSQAERIKWLDDNAMKPAAEEGSSDPFSFAPRRFVTVPEILQELLRMKKTDAGYYSKSREMGQYLNSLEGRWSMIGNKKNKIYGCQKTWERMVTDKNFSVTESVTVLGNQEYDELNSL